MTITTGKDFARALNRLSEIGYMLTTLGKEVRELSDSIPFPGKRVTCKNGMIVDGKFIPAGMGAESITDDLLEDWERTSMIKDRFESIEKRIDAMGVSNDRIEKMLHSGIAVDIPALEIDAMSESEIDKESDDAVVERAEKAIRKKVN